MRLRQIGGYLAALVVPGNCHAWAAAATPMPSPAMQDYHAPGGMFQIAIYFVLIVAALVAGLYFTRSGFNMRPRKSKADRKLVISETRTLGNRQFLVVAEYENRKMLLGICPGRIDYLSTLSGEETFSKELEDKLE